MKQFFTTFFAVLFGLAAAVLLVQQLTKNNKEEWTYAAFLAQGVSDAVPYRIAVAEHWQAEGELACTKEQLNYGGYGEISSRSLARIELSGCGQLTLQFDEKTGVAAGKVILQAEVVNNAFGQEIDWQCFSDDYPSIATYLPQCRYISNISPDDISAATKPVEAISAAASTTVVDAQASSCSKGSDLYHAMFTDQIVGNAPHDRLVTIGPTREEIFFFTEIIGAGGQQVMHRWFHNNVMVSDVAYAVKGDRWPTWSSQLLGLLGEGLLRVEVHIDDCLIGQQSVLIADREIVNIVDNMKHGWMRPAQAMESVLARQASETAGDATRRSAADALTEAGDTLLIQALRNRDEKEALWLIESVDLDTLSKLNDLTLEDQERYWTEADPFLKAADGSTPLQLAKATGMETVLKALEASILEVNKRSRKNSLRRNSGRWGDSLFTIAGGSNVRFDDGDTPLHRAVRTNNERAVATMLGFGAVDPASEEYKPKVDLYAFDRAGQQPLEIARASGFTGVEHLLLIAHNYLVPEWAVLRASFAMEILDNQPSDCRKVAYEDEPAVFFFAELADLKGRSVVHEWHLDNVVQHQQEFFVTDNRYASVSMRKFIPADAGRWKVVVRTADGRRLAVHQLTYKMHDDYSRKNRSTYIGSADCELGLGTLYALARAQAPIAQIDYLFEKGLKFNQRRSQFKDVFKIALEDGNITLVRWFLERGFGLEREIIHRKSPMTVVAANGDAPMTLYLLNQGALLSEENGASLLRNAALRNHVGVARILLDRDVNPNTIGRAGATPLSDALANCNLGVAVLLLQSGANQELLLSENNPELPANRSGTLKERAGNCIKYKTWSVDNPAVEYLLSL